MLPLPLICFIISAYEYRVVLSKFDFIHSSHLILLHIKFCIKLWRLEFSTVFVNSRQVTMLVQPAGAPGAQQVQISAGPYMGHAGTTTLQPLVCQTAAPSAQGTGGKQGSGPATTQRFLLPTSQG